MGSSYHIDEATAADIPAVASLEREIFPDPWSIDAFWAARGEVFLVARSGDALSGYLIARAVPPEGEILSIGVATTERRSGIGGGLMQSGLEILERRGVDQIYLEVRESNSSALSFYTNRGFAVVGRRSGYYRSPREDALVMRRQILPVQGLR